MRALCFEQFQQPPKLMTLPDPVPSDEGVVVQVEATGSAGLIGMDGWVMMRGLHYLMYQGMNLLAELWQRVVISKSGRSATV